MANKVNINPNLPRKVGAPTIQSLDQYDQDFLNRVQSELREHATRLNLSYPMDGTEQLTVPVRLKEYTVATVPSAVTYKAGLIAVTNETGGYTVAFSDGTNWRRVQDRAVVS